MTPQAAKSVPAPTFGAIKPPPRKRRSGAEVSPELLSALATALETANGDWTGDGLEYPTLGKAQSASQRYRRLLVQDNAIADIKDVASRVWQDGDVYRMALRLRDESEVAS